MVIRPAGRPRLIAVSLALAATLVMALAATADAFTREFVRYTSSYQWARYGNYHSITYNSARVPTRSDGVCVAMITEAGNRRGGQNFCGYGATFSSVCFSTGTPMTDAWMYWGDRFLASQRMDGRIDNSTNHTGCVY